MSFRKVVVVTGGAGFIGSHLVDALLADYDVVCVDNYITGKLDNLISARKIAESRGSKLIELELDVTDSSLYEKVSIEIARKLNGRRVHACMNLACPASPVAYQTNPMKTLDTCYLGARNVMAFAKAGAIVLHTSTSEVYGDPEVHPQDESYKGSVNTWGIRACYDEGKRAAETICFEHLRAGYDVRVVRIFNTYGPRMQPDDGRVVSNFIMQSLLGKDITIYGDGSQTRSFCYVSDLVSGLLAYLNKQAPHSTPINLGNPYELTVKQVADLVVSMTKSNSKISYVPLPQDDPTKRKPSIALANDVLGWFPKKSFDDGVIATIDYFRELLNSAK